MTQLDCFPLPRGPLADAVGRVGGWQITSYFGGRIDPLRGVPSHHGGQDIAGAGIALQPLYAVKPGYVSQGWDPGGGGNWTTLYTDEGPRFGYGHADHFAPGVNGRHVGAGEILAYVDSTGASTGSHLHFAYGPTRTSGYGDPFDLLQDAANAGRYAGAAPMPPVRTPPEGLTMSDLDALMQRLDRIETKLGTNLSLEADWENDTRSVIINGVEMLITRQAGEITEAGWASRSYPVKFDDSPAVLYHDQGGLRWVKSQEDLVFLTRTLLNPHVQEFPASERARILADHPIVGDVPPGF